MSKVVQRCLWFIAISGECVAMNKREPVSGACSCSINRSCQSTWSEISGSSIKISDPGSELRTAVINARTCFCPEDKYESSNFLIGVNSLNRMRMSATFGSSSEMIFEGKTRIISDKSLCTYFESRAEVGLGSHTISDFLLDFASLH